MWRCTVQAGSPVWTRVKGNVTCGWVYVAAGHPEASVAHARGGRSWSIWCLHSCFSHIFLLLSLSSWCAVFLNYVTPETLPLALMGSALASSGPILELAGTGSVWHGCRFWCLLSGATPAALLPKPCLINPKWLLVKANTLEANTLKGLITTQNSNQHASDITHLDKTI